VVDGLVVEGGRVERGGVEWSGVGGVRGVRRGREGDWV